ncbi:hypothetical protein ALC57_03395 [Trachymyrmex cornetzi]|uniref:Uncharacterized protein n=1 Tax=Trachymyrmex cornetzi TaxID=471704 RepID=A0A195EFN3_9HYME|nr:hypothetical protein ALC57_03395 [Trachymyrmex cornetzi]
MLGLVSRTGERGKHACTFHPIQIAAQINRKPRATHAPPSRTDDIISVLRLGFFNFYKTSSSNT